ncbi:BAHD1 [Cordylochernes scorpioides]|uniref:BAHD1 n=1 Tax=Cordylochernes scorpioides TaxID=51811 RepID=A0ABY6KEE4_9ARAC|nr:BAHD1 [Cordylochernes scorpioides]
MVKKYQKNLLPNLNKKVASNKPEEVKGKKDLRVRAKAQEDEAQVSSSTDVQQAADSLPPQVKKAATSASSKFHGWSWLGEPYEKLVYKSNDETATLKLCYPAIHHIEGDTIRERDSVLLRSAKGRVEQPYVAKITAFWENEEGDMMMSLLWYYRPEHSDRSRHMEDEIFASKHKDINGVGCIDDKCYVLTFFEYCRYRKESKRIQEGSLPYPNLVPGPDDGYPRSCRLPVPGVVSPESVMFCRQVYDFRQKRLLKNPS